MLLLLLLLLLPLMMTIQLLGAPFPRLRSALEFVEHAQHSKPHWA
jgi:hypothetical protein